MTWLAWRQFRIQAALAAVMALAVTIVLVVTRDHVAQTTDGDLSTGYKSLQLLGTALIGAPAFVGAFWGAPLLARELEAGTHRLAWTQSVTRARWLAVKLGIASLVTIVAVVVFSAAFTWWSIPLDRFGNRIGTADFGQRGVAPVAYALFALALGTLLGAVTRRVLPSMVATLAGFFVVRFAFQLLVRPNLLATEVATRPSNLFGAQGATPATNDAWVLSSHLVDGSGHAITVRAAERAMAQACTLTRDSTVADNVGCVNQLGIHDVLRIHPADHFWTLQALESAAFVALALALGAMCFWWVRHRTS